MMKLTSINKLRSSSKPPSTPSKNLSPSLALAAKPIPTQSAISARKLLSDGFFPDASWKPQDSKLSSLEAIIALDFKTASRRDLVAIVAMFKTLEKFETKFCNFWLEEYEGLRTQQFDHEGQSVSNAKEKSTQVRGLRAMAKTVPFPFLEMALVIRSKYLLMRESGLFQDFNFETNEGNLL